MLLQPKEEIDVPGKTVISGAIQASFNLVRIL